MDSFPTSSYKCNSSTFHKTCVCVHDSTTHKLPIPLPLSFLLIKQHKYDNRWDKANSYTVELSMPERAIFNALT